MPTPKVSVVVPIYNVEPYIERCARSLLEQTLPEIEYIFVNDCTPDASMEVLQRVLEDYPERKPWVRIINMPENSGQAKVREVGIKATTGEYVIHCDSDDWVDTDMYRAMYEKAVEEMLDIVVCGFKRIFDDGSEEEYNLNTSICVEELLTAPMGGSLCLKMVKRKYYMAESIILPEEDMLEDMIYTVQLVSQAHNISFVPNAYYNYYVNRNSISYDCTESGFLRRSQGWSKNVALLCDLLSDMGLEQKCDSVLTKMKLKGREFMWPLVLQQPRKYLSLWTSTFPELNWKYPLMTSEPFTLRLIFFLTLCRIYPYCRRLLKSK